MQAALDVSFYVLGVVFTLGLLMVLVLIRDVFFHGRFNTHLPTAKRVPTTALDAARETLNALRQALPATQGERRDAVAYEIKHLEHRIAALEDKTFTDQADYYDAVKARERVWREWRAAHEQARHAALGHRREARNKSEELRQAYRRLDQEVGEEYLRAVARDTLTLEELQTQGVLSLEVLAPPEPTTPPRPTGESAAPPEASDVAQTQGEEPPAPQPPDASTPQPARARKWMTPLPPYPPSQGGLLGQADIALPDVVKSERTYVDPTFTMATLPGGILSGTDFTRSSFAEVEFVGVQRFAGCRFAAADLRRIEMRRAESPHVFQDCDLQGASLAQAQLAGVVFRRCNLAGTHWRSARLDRVKFEECRLDGAHWEGVDLSRTVMSEDMLAQADFSFAAKPPLNLRPVMDSPPELEQAGPTPAPDPDAAPSRRRAAPGPVPSAPAPDPDAAPGPGPRRPPAEPAQGDAPAARPAPSPPPPPSATGAPSPETSPGEAPAPESPED